MTVSDPDDFVHGALEPCGKIGPPFQWNALWNALMSLSPSPVIHDAEHRIGIPGGHLFARSWTPEPAAAGRRAPILLFHDSLGCVELWRGFPRRLAAVAGRRVIAYDRLGFGRSDAHPGHLTLDFIAREAEEVIPVLCRQLAADEIIVCGHSVGGGMAVETAARHPRQCRALITLAAQAFVEEKTVAAIRAASLGFEEPANLARVAKYHGPKARWVIDAWVNTWLSPDFAGWSVSEVLTAVQCPVLAIQGEDDEYGSAEHPRRIAAGRGTARILPGIGHVPHREQEHFVAEMIRSFLAGMGEDGGW